MRMARRRGGTGPVEFDQRRQRHEGLIGHEPPRRRQLPVGYGRPLMMSPMGPGEMRRQQGGLPALQVEAMGRIGSLMFEPQAEPERTS